MNWYERCINELDRYNLFDNTAQRERFRDLISCYYEAPFFSKGLAKCMYLACWDEE